VQEKIIWCLSKFESLTSSALYGILRLRSEVFVVEQQCIFLDLDNLDQQAYHLEGKVNDELVASARILPPGIPYHEPSIGRVVASPAWRRKGAGMALMQKAIEETMGLYGEVAVKIGAQLYLKQFYEKHGFVQSSDVYMEDAIPHIKMTRTP
jgi:ElaA protein